MKVITVLGSPKYGGNTGRVLEWVEEALRADGHEVERVMAKDVDVRPCMGCYACQSVPDAPGCVQPDEGNALFSRMAAADAIVLASPLYCWDFTAQIKPIVDRCLCVATGYGSSDHTSILEGRRMGLLITCAGPEAGNADLVPVMFKRCCGYTKTVPAAELIVAGCESPDKLGDDVRRRAAEFAAQLTGA